MSVEKAELFACRECFDRGLVIEPMAIVLQTNGGCRLFVR
jgi:hypothetical protein